MSLQTLDKARGHMMDVVLQVDEGEEALAGRTQ